jgi:hypothetical protein
MLLQQKASRIFGQKQTDKQAKPIKILLQKYCPKKELLDFLPRFTAFGSNELLINQKWFPLVYRMKGMEIVEKIAQK